MKVDTVNTPKLRLRNESFSMIYVKTVRCWYFLLKRFQIFTQVSNLCVDGRQLINILSQHLATFIVHVLEQYCFLTRVIAILVFGPCSDLVNFCGFVHTRQKRNCPKSCVAITRDSQFLHININ